MSKILKSKIAGLPVFSPASPITGRKGKNGEMLEAIDFHSHVMHNHPGVGMMLFHVTNEGKRHPARGLQLKQAGLIAGVSDYIFLMPNKKYNYAAFELKTECGGSGADANQKRFLKQCIAAGGYGCIVHGFHAALYAFELYINNKTL